MKVLVTGGAGYIGSVTTKHLIDAGHEVVIFDSMELGHKEAIDPRASLIVGDLRNYDDILGAMQKVQPDAVMHFAAYALVGESSENPGKYFRNNDVGGVNLADAMQACGVKRIVFSSTRATYGQPEKMPILETTPQCPTNPYGQSKFIYEQMLRWYQKIHGFRPVFLRYFNACGAEGGLGEDHAIETHIIPNVLKVAMGQSDEVRIFGGDYPTPDGTCIRDYVHLKDLCTAHVLALEKNCLGAYNLGTGEGASVMQIVDACRKITGHPIPVRICPPRLGDPPALYASGKKARLAMGWEPRFSDLETIVRDAWTFALSNAE